MTLVEAGISAAAYGDDGFFDMADDTDLKAFVREVFERMNSVDGEVLILNECNGDETNAYYAALNLMEHFYPEDGERPTSETISNMEAAIDKWTPYMARLVIFGTDHEVGHA